MEGKLLITVESIWLVFMKKLRILKLILYSYPSDGAFAMEFNYKEFV